MFETEPGGSNSTRDEARRMLAICNICGYCNGFCPVFDAARERPVLRAGDLAYLAHLCHACRSCLEACQYAPPHAFSVNVPRTLERLRWRDYADFAWPKGLASLMRASDGAWRTGLAPALALGLAPGLAMLAPVLLGIWLLPWSQLTQSALASGDFYRIVPFSVMVGLGLLTLGWALLSIGISLVSFWRAISLGRPPARLTWSGLRAALWDIASLRHLDGGGPGCTDSHTRLAPMRRWLHQLLVLGFLFCLAATLIAAFWHHGLERAAPYAADSLPVVLGLLGGLLMLPAGLGLWWLRRRTNPKVLAPEVQGGETSASLWLLAVVLSGLALLIGRSTPAMGMLLLAHLGAVYGFFLLLPVSKFVHAGYRLLAVLRLRLERRAPGAD